MSTYQSSKVHCTSALALVKKIKDISNELVLATSQEDPVNKYCFDGAIAEKAKVVESAKEKYDTTAKEFDVVNEQLKSAVKRLDSINLEYVNMQQENKLLKNEVQMMKGKEGVEEELHGWNDSRLKLNLYKKMTGLHFDLNMADDDLTGFVAVKADGKHHSGLVPFTLKRDEPNISTILWGKIGEVLQTISEDHCEAVSMNLQNRLENKYV